MEVLIIEDDQDINDLLRDVLNRQFSVHQAVNGAAGLKLLKQQQIDVVLLDLMLPDISGENLIGLIKEQSSAKIIVLTAKADVDVLVEVLRLGADDYIAKPFDTKEVVARILKQCAVPSSVDILMYRGFTLDVRAHQLTYNDQVIDLRAKEFELLQCFFAEPSRIFTKSYLYESVWHETYYGDDNTISVHLSRLRHKLSSYDADLIETVWGIGFKLKS